MLYFNNLYLRKAKIFINKREVPLVYFVANIKIEDETEYNKYLDSEDEVFSKI
jgi:hypothetical protein